MNKHIGKIPGCGMAKPPGIATLFLGATMLFSDAFFLEAQTASKPKFEVSSIKVAQDCGNVASGVRAKIPGGTYYQPGGRYTTCNLLQS